MRSVAMLNPTLTLTILLLTMMYILSTLSGSPLPAGKTGPGPSVKTRYGIVQGMILSLPNPLNPVEVFLGIPYATPPLGINRFSPTRNPQSWSGTRMADRHGPACPQRFPLDLNNETESLRFMSRARREHLLHVETLLSKNQSEDCLYLNIYAPFQGRPANPVDRLPVLVFIHGESFDWGSSLLYDGSLLSSYSNLVVVTLNFRLGVLGFLNVGRWPKGKPRLANFGLMDQVAALHWVQENIGEFGGDPGRVTLVGYGAGAACIHFLMTSPAVVNGLFQRGIMMSGSAHAPWALVTEANDVALQVAQAADCVHLVGDRSDSETILNCLRDAPLDILDRAASKVTATISRPGFHRHFRTLFGPSIDGVVVRGGSQNPSSVNSPNFASGTAGSKSKRMSGNGDDGRTSYDFLFGVTGFESSYLLSETAVESGMDGLERDGLLRSFVSDTYRFHQTEIFLTLVNEYTDWERTIQHPLSVRDSTVEALSDGQFVAPAIQLGDTLSNDKSAYFYVLDYAMVQRPQALHGFELSLLFGWPLLMAGGLSGSSGGWSPYPSGRNYSRQDAANSEAIMTLFANFARTGNPNEPQEEKFRLTKDRNRLKGVTWEPYEKRQRKYLEIGSKPKMKSQFRAHRMAVLLQLLPELQRTGQHDVIQGHGILTPEGVDPPASLPAWVNGSYVDVTRQRIPPHTGKDVTCVPLAPGQPHTPTASPSTSNATTGTNNGSSIAIPAGNGGYQGEATIYSTALSVTIAIGCSLLILNVLTFAGLYYRRDRKRQQQQQQQQLQQVSMQRSVSDTSSHAAANGGILRIAGNRSGSTTSTAIDDCETLYLQTPSLSGTQVPIATTVLKAGSNTTLTRQRCYDLVGPAVTDRSLLDVRFDPGSPNSPIPPDKDFL